MFVSSRGVQAAIDAASSANMPLIAYYDARNPNKRCKLNQKRARARRAKPKQVFRPERPLQYLSNEDYTPKPAGKNDKWWHGPKIAMKKDEMYTLDDDVKGPDGWWCVESMYGERGWVPCSKLRVMPNVPWRSADPPPTYKDLYPQGPPGFVVDKIMEDCLWVFEDRWM